MRNLRPGREWDFTAAVGSDIDVTHEIVDQDGDIVDLHGADIRVLVRRHLSEDSAGEFTVTVINYEAARVRLLLDDIDLDVGEYRYDEHVRLAADGEGYRADHYPLWGTITIVDAVTPEAVETP